MHNLLADRFERGFDLILCRNVVIYSTDEVVPYATAKFRRVWKDDGILSSEALRLSSRTRSIPAYVIIFYRRAPRGPKLLLND